MLKRGRLKVIYDIKKLIFEKLVKLHIHITVHTTYVCAKNIFLFYLSTVLFKFGNDYYKILAMQPCFQLRQHFENMCFNVYNVSFTLLYRINKNLTGHWTVHQGN